MKLKIRDKLFFAMLLANVIVVAGLYVLSNWSFNLSFKEYLDAKREKELAPLILELSEQYQSNGHWQWLEGPRNPYWRILMDEFVFKRGSLQKNYVPIGPPRPEHRPNRDKRPRGERKARQELGHLQGVRHEEKRRPLNPQLNNKRPPPNSGAMPRYFLADQQRKLVVGRDFENQKIKWIDIISDGNIVGFIGYEQTNEVTSALDQIFIQKLKDNLSWSLLLVLFISALITLELARRFVKPIQRIKNATQAVAKGDYSTQIQISSMDEIGELSQDFNRLVKSLEHNLTARQQWIADISHELRTPVAILQGEIEAIQDGVRKADNDSFNSLHQEIIRLSKLINDLHELSMSDSGALSYRFEKINLAEIIQDVFVVEYSLIQKHQFIIKHSQPLKPIIISADLLRLTQLFMNLLNNSLLYSEQSGVIEVNYKIEKRNVIINWSDSEPGVTNDQLKQLFERLYRAESSRNRNSGGSGLGLSISKNIVEAHNGSIKALHSPLGGVEFRIELPIL